ncbi:acyl-CoA dehydratase activase [Clostridiaceae bacterium M8S5]|nr:acyl-CoA dehydratase activase [Clostridiaceae bacterium M8S5]
MYSIGIDSGSSTTKGILFDGKDIIKKSIIPTGPNPRKAINEIYKELNSNTEVYTVTTGYGRKLLEQADKKVTEITCHSKGADFLKEDISAVIDIGGQDSKVILLDEDRNVSDFLMNDKCAAGTGRFVEIIMRILQQDLEHIDEFVANVTPTKISSMCTVFAESEVISLLAQDVDARSIALGVLESICNRTVNFANRLPIQGKVFFSGGLAQYSCIKNLLQEKLGLKVYTHKLSQYCGAIGAALIGYNEIKNK